MTQYTKHFGKLDENGKLIYAPYTIKTANGFVLITTDPEEYKKRGYYPIVDLPYPQDDYIYERSIWKKENKIYNGWIKVKKREENLGNQEIDDLKANLTEIELAIAELYESINTTVTAVTE